MSSGQSGSGDSLPVCTNCKAQCDVIDEESGQCEFCQWELKQAVIGVVVDDEEKRKKEKKKADKRAAASAIDKFSRGDRCKAAMGCRYLCSDFRTALRWLWSLLSMVLCCRVCRHPNDYHGSELKLQCKACCTGCCCCFCRCCGKLHEDETRVERIVRETRLFWTRGPREWEIQHSSTMYCSSSMYSGSSSARASSSSSDPIIEL